MPDLLSQNTIRRLLKSKKFRDEKNQFVFEGSRWLTEALTNDLSIISMYVTDQWISQSSFDISHIPHQVITSGEMKSFASTTTPSGILAVARKPVIKWPKKTSQVLIIDGIRDPGNLGTLIRSSRAVGVDGILLSPQTTDLYNPKVVRSTMGGLLKIPIMQASWEEIIDRTQHLGIFGADALGKMRYTEVDWTKPSSLIVGNEAHGLSEEARGMCKDLIYIPMQNQTESLNAAISASIILFESQRQRQISE